MRPHRNLLVGLGSLGLFFLALSLGSSTKAQDSETSGPMTSAAGQSSASPSAQQPAPQLTRRPQAAPLAPADPNAPKVEVPAGTHLSLVLHNAISTHSARPGDPVYFETLFPILIDGRVAIPAGSYVSGEVTEAKRAGHIKGRAEIMIKLNTLILPNAYEVNLNAMPSGAGTGGRESVNNEGKIVGDTHKAQQAGTVISSTATGTGIGAVAGGLKGAGIGAGIGAAAGLTALMFTRGPDATLPRGSTVEAVLEHSVFLEADRDQFSSPGQASTLAGPPNREPRRTSPFPF